MADEVRLIDANALLSEVYGDGDLSKKETRAAVLLMIEKSPTIEAQPNKGWISVEERLPEDDGDVLLHDKYCGTVIGWYDKKENVFKTDYTSQLEAVTRWMSLPEDPKEE